MLNRDNTGGDNQITSGYSGGGNQKPSGDTGGDDIQLQDSSEIDTLSGDYDPHLHRDRKHPSSNFITLMLLVKGMIGTGIFAVPRAISQAGYVIGPIFSILIGLLLLYCLHMLIRSQYTLCKRRRFPSMTYPMTMKFALEEGPPFMRFLAPFGLEVVNVFLLINQLGIGCVYIVFVTTNVKAAVDTWYVIDLKYYMLMLLVPLTLVMSIRNLNNLGPLGFIANIAVFFGIGVILSNVFIDTPSLKDRNMFGTFYEFPLFFGTVLFALVTIGIVMSVENNMKTPKSFGTVLNCAMGFVIVVYVIFGFLGYLKYGEDIRDSITLNLPPGAVTTKIVQFAYSLTITMSYALQSYVTVEIIWGYYLSNRIKNQCLGEYAVRFAVILFTFALAISIANLGLFISLFGGFCLSMLGVAFPAIIEICVLYPFNFGRFNYVLIRDVILIIIGIIALFTGTTISIIDLVKSFQQ